MSLVGNLGCTPRAEYRGQVSCETLSAMLSEGPHPRQELGRPQSCPKLGESLSAAVPQDKLGFRPGHFLQQQQGAQLQDVSQSPSPNSTRGKGWCRPGRLQCPPHRSSPIPVDLSTGRQWMLGGQAQWERLKNPRWWW